MNSSSNYKNIITQTQKYVKKYMNSYNDISHDYNHICEVVKLSLIIAKKEGVKNKRNLFHIKMGALLHDIADSKYIKNGSQYKVINKFLLSLKKLNKTDKKEILKISTNTSLSKDNNITFNKKNIKLYIVQDADRINSLGSIGIMRYISYNIKNKKKSSFTEIIDTMKKRTNKIKQFLKTKTAKNISIKHFKLINSFINNYKKFIIMNQI
jgi:uncharacterized protein